MDSKKIIVVFGGSGDVGQAIIKNLKVVLKDNFSIVSTFHNNKAPYSFGIKQIMYDASSQNNELMKYLSTKNLSHVFFCIGTVCKNNLINTSEEEINHFINVNALSFLNIYKSLFETCRQNKTKFIVISSTAAVHNRATYGTYSASKSILESLVKTLAKEEEHYGVTFNILQPSVIDSKLARQTVNRKEYENFDDYVTSKLNNKILKLDQVAKIAVDYALNEKYDKINGAIINDFGEQKYLNSEKIVETTIQDMMSNEIINNSQYEIISDANNLVVKIDSKFLKIYLSGNSTIKDNELLLYNKTKRPELYKKMLFSGTVGTENDKHNYALFETVRGKTIDEINYTKENATKIVKTIFDYIQDTTQIKCKGFGDINQNFEGLYDNFPEFIFDLLHKTSTTLFMEPSTRKYSKLGYELLVENTDLVNIDKSLIIPVDLNFKNIMVTDNDKIIIVDPGALIAAPVEMAYGEIMAHGYGTNIYEEFKKYIGSVNENTIRLFAVISLLNILAFVIKLGLNPVQAKPFGNPNSFFTLIDEHTAYLKNK